LYKIQWRTTIYILFYDNSRRHALLSTTPSTEKNRGEKFDTHFCHSTRLKITFVFISFVNKKTCWRNNKASSLVLACIDKDPRINFITYLIGKCLSHVLSRCAKVRHGHNVIVARKISVELILLNMIICQMYN
jgi:hypothetical protein